MVLSRTKTTGSWRGTLLRHIIDEYLKYQEEVLLRALAAFRPIAGELSALGEDGAAVVHGGVIMALCAALAMPEQDYYQWRVPCCGGWLLDLEQWPETERFTVLGALPRKEERR